MIVVALQKLIFFMVFSPVISVLYLVGNIMENSEPLPGPYKGFPLGGSCRPQATDEGGVRGSLPFTGTRRKAAPHPASGGASATFPKEEGI